MIFSQHIKTKDILVIGDAMLDSYYSGEISRISPEAPVPVFQKLSERCALGGAGNVAANLRAAGQNVSLVAVLGKDAEGELVAQCLDQLSVERNLLIWSESRRTTVKARFLASNHQVFRMDMEDTVPLAAQEYQPTLVLLEEYIQRFSLVILSDYMKGLLTPAFTKAVIAMANRHGIRVLADVKDVEYQKYAGSFLMKPNLRELRALTGKNATSYAEIADASVGLCQACGCEYVLTTCGERGMVLAEQSGRHHIVESVPAEIYDVTGAGDTVIAYMAVCLSSGLDMMAAVTYANIAAGIQVSKAGASPVSCGEVDEWLQKNDKDRMGQDKIITRESLCSFKARHPGKTIVLTNGCYDILHIGHVQYLRKAALLGDILIVAVNSDESVRRLKGMARPINGENERAELLAALEFVDYVVIFSEDTPYEVVREVLPDVLVKGADYRPDQVAGKDIVEQNGGRLELIPIVEGKSTSAILEKLAGL